MTLTEQPAASTPGHADPAPEPQGNTSSILKLLVGLALITAVFIAAGWGALLLFIVILIVIVMLHELGHFATAKWSGMKVTEYFVGFGPRLWSIRRGETEYGVKAIPAGGYVRITGFTAMEDVPEEDEPRTYRQQPFSKRILVASAGSIMHFLIAFVLAIILVLSFGHTTNNWTIGSIESWPGHGPTPAQVAGLKVGDTIVSVNGKTFSDPATMTDLIKHSTGKQLELGVERNGHLIHLDATPASGKGISVNGQALGSGGHLGIGIQQATASVGPLSAIGHSFNTMWQVTDQELHGIGQVFSPSGFSSVWHQITNPNYASKVAKNPGDGTRPVSVIGITHLGAQAEQNSIYGVLMLLIAVNLVFGILNMLPIIPLDGGHVAIAGYEWIRTKKGKPYYRADITKLFPVAAVFIALLAFMSLAAIYLDITHPINLPH